MKKDYKVRAVNGDSVELVPYDKDSCAGCSSSCAECHVSLSAINPKHFDLKPGMKVSANVFTLFQSFCNIMALVIPICFAVLGFFISPFLAKLLNFSSTETFKAVTVLCFLFVPSVIIFFLTRNKSELVQLQVIGIKDN